MPGGCSSDGTGEHPINWKWGEFTDLPQTTLTSDIHCVTAVLTPDRLPVDSGRCCTL
jgi:hypothetical protein